MPKVSIIVPVYNVEKYLPKCLDSLVSQTLDDIEVIVVNDGTPDNSQAIIDDYAERYPDIIKPFIKENGGLSDARNFAIEKATGEYIGFVDSDDYVDIDMYSKLYNKAIETASDIVVCGFNNIILNKDLTIKKIKQTLIENPYIFGNSIYDAPEILAFSKSYACNKLFKRELFSDLKFPTRQLFEDSAIIYNVLSLAKKIELVNEALYQYVTSRKNSITNEINDSVFDIFKSCDSIIYHYKKIGKYEELYDEIESICLMHIQARYPAFKKKGSLKLKLKYVDIAFDYFEKHFPNWRNNKYFLRRNAASLTKDPFNKYHFDKLYRNTLKKYYIKTTIENLPKNIRKQLKILYKRITSKPKATHKIRTRTLTAKELRELQLVTINVLKTVVDFCNENKLRYYLSEGSLLGAIRHGGFIPWDDDMDIAMPRNDYEKFIELWGDKEINNCILAHQSINNNYYLPFSKILFTGKCKFRSLLHKNLKFKIRGNNIGLDIFPLDESSPISIDLFTRARKIRRLRNVLLAKVGYMRNPKKIRIYRFAKIFNSYESLHKKLLELYTMDNGKNKPYIANFASSYIITKEIFPREWFEPAREIIFEGIKVTIPAESEKMLTRIYGDYMTPPPEEKRVSPHKYYVEDAINKHD